jgi:hypothetical protein
MCAVEDEYGYDKHQEKRNNSDSRSSSSGDSFAEKVNQTDNISCLLHLLHHRHANAVETVTFVNSILYLDDGWCVRHFCNT